MPTAGFSHIKLSAEQSSSGSGPSEFKLQTSTDLSHWSDVPQGGVHINDASSYGCPKQSCKLVNLSLPNTDDKQLLYIRWLVNANKAVDRDENPTGIRGGGSSRIRSIQVTGERIKGKQPAAPTIALMHAPLDHADKVSAADPLKIKFSKMVSVADEQSISVTDEQGRQAAGLKFQITDDHTLLIQHDPFQYNQKVKVAIGKSAIKGEDGVPLARDLTWTFEVQDSPTMPKLINMTFNGDPKTSLSFAWYTDVKTDTKIQLIESSRMEGKGFPASSAKEYIGSSEEISTYMTQEDRTSGSKTKFYSHKVTAERLTPGTSYNFRVGNGTEWSEIGSFTTDTAKSEPFHFIVGSDSQASN
ncbi:fibronectin type III domain-containing protein, partial [Streptomyces sp. NPDC056154]|uniref:fibronectin type III domain-containing protein n=1 Tax=Streptomyces sp. NPDC056154 TaxID=3345729 RepID=UPI0035D5B86D